MKKKITFNFPNKVTEQINKRANSFLLLFEPLCACRTSGSLIGAYTKDSVQFYNIFGELSSI